MLLLWAITTKDMKPTFKAKYINKRGKVIANGGRGDEGKPTLRDELIKLIGEIFLYEHTIPESADQILKLIQKRIPKEDKKPKFSVTNYDEYVWGRVDGWNACIAEMKEEING